MEPPVLHADAELLAVAKPPGRIVIPGRKGGEATLQEELEARFGRLWICHRLDRGTSGVLLLARTAAAHRAVSLAFERHAVEKRYLAVIAGALPDAVRVDAALVPARRGRMRPARPGEAGAKPAATAFRVVERLRRPEATALVEARPETGRQHQIRVHLRTAGAPLALDPDYGRREPLRDGAGRVILDRTPLHAAALALAHPTGGGRLLLEAPLPPDLEALLAWARGA